MAEQIDRHVSGNPLWENTYRHWYDSAEPLSFEQWNELYQFAELVRRDPLGEPRLVDETWLLSIAVLRRGARDLKVFLDQVPEPETVTHWFYGLRDRLLTHLRVIDIHTGQTLGTRDDILRLGRLAKQCRSRPFLVSLVKLLQLTDRGSTVGECFDALFRELDWDPKQQESGG
jgi:hypothetical protein